MFSFHLSLCSIYVTHRNSSNALFLFPTSCLWPLLPLLCMAKSSSRTQCRCHLFKTALCRSELLSLCVLCSCSLEQHLVSHLCPSTKCNLFEGVCSYSQGKVDMWALLCVYFLNLFSQNLLTELV